ncbi:Fungal specific transcription factor domain [Teratosphaeria destructans]|uniref:Fungal specific transcription factor domain n=1 Tax=Teratosphaeria destructans TaxID=418781 RepID=A0A9W7W7H7_9PEZI|nr:Fungal specific transcription factor domain [Teratosphaeria destructans]
MADGITIPSPSVFLRNSPDLVPPSPPNAPRPTQHVRRKSQETKKKAPRKASAADGGGDGSQAKPKQTKSRNGCVTCKQKRLKCGEEKPTCANCAKRNVECGGYKKDFKWRPFEETNVKSAASPPAQAARVPATTAPVSTAQTSAESSKPTTPTDEVVPQQVLTVRTYKAPLSSPSKDSKRPKATSDDESTTPLSQRPVKAKRKSRAQSPETVLQSPIEEEKTETGTPNVTSPGISPPQEAKAVTFNNTSPVWPEVSHTGTGLSPTITEIMFPFTGEPPPASEFVNFSMPDGMSIPLSPIHNDVHNQVLDPLLVVGDLDGHYLDINPHDASDGVLSVFLASRDRSQTAPQISAEEWIDIWTGPMDYSFTHPRLPLDSEEALILRFDRLTCGILSIMDGLNDNPWRTSIWSIAQTSPALRNAILAMTAFHSAADVPALKLAGIRHKAKAIEYMSEGIRDNSIAQQHSIATALALGFVESWEEPSSSGNMHIKGAQQFVNRAIEQHRLVPLYGKDLARLKFLCNAWVYMDVMARLTAVDCDESEDFDFTFEFENSDPNLMGDNGFGINFGLPVDARLDPLMGCANTLFPLIGRVANLVRKICRSQSTSPSVISQANDLKVALETWDPPDYIEPPEDPTTDVQHTIQTAEAYRWATILHLHQSVPELPSRASTAELAQQVLQYLATVPPVSRCIVVQVFPLLAAGCEAKTEEDRDFVRQRWHFMERRMRIGVPEHAARVCEEVWRRRDAYEAQPPTQRRLVATANLHPSRQHGAPLERNSVGGYQDRDPGRTGMVFTYMEDDEVQQQNRKGNLFSDRLPPIRSSQDVLKRHKGRMDPAYTVRGHLHWVGVMWDWQWQVLLA